LIPDRAPPRWRPTLLQMLHACIANSYPCHLEGFYTFSSLSSPQDERGGSSYPRFPFLRLCPGQSVFPLLCVVTTDVFFLPPERPKATYAVVSGTLYLPLPNDDKLGPPLLLLCGPKGSHLDLACSLFLLKVFRHLFWVGDDFPLKMPFCAIFLPRLLFPVVDMFWLPRFSLGVPVVFFPFGFGSRPSVLLRLLFSLGLTMCFIWCGGRRCAPRACKMMS